MPLARPPEFVVCPLMCQIQAFRYFWPSSQPNEFGFKRLSLENWLTVDPVWDAFGNSEPSEWVHDVLKAATN